MEECTGMHWDNETRGIVSNNLLRLVCGFPSIGKSYLCRKMGWHDSDSSQFSHQESWPVNYLEHLRSLNGLGMVSTHKEVRDVLADAGMTFDLCYPSRELKKDYLTRYRERGSPVTFINLLDRMWSEWITEMEEETRCHARFVLCSGEFASDVIFE